MLAYVLLACLAVPLVILIVDVAVPRRGHSAPLSGPPVAMRPHVSASSEHRRSPHRGEDAQAEGAPRAPRIAPGDGMVYRGPARSR